MKKRLFFLLFVAGIVLLLDAKLRIRQENPSWQTKELLCYIEQKKVKGGVLDSSADEDEVRALNNDIVMKYDSGVYQAKWAPERQRMLNIQSHLGHTVPESASSVENDEFDSSY